MSWNYQRASWGYHDLHVWKQHGKWSYALVWRNEAAITIVGRGSEKYADVYGAREAAILHLASILPKPQSGKLLAEQTYLAWVPVPD